MGWLAGLVLAGCLAGWCWLVLFGAGWLANWRLVLAGRCWVVLAGWRWLVLTGRQVLAGWLSDWLAGWLVAL